MTASAPPATELALEARGVAKSYGPVTALRDVSLAVGRGEVVGLIGDNGAGKSTLVKILSGLYRPDRGELVVNGEQVKLRSVTHARSLGIDTVYQDLALVDQLSVYHNMFLKREVVAAPLPLLRNREMRRQADRVLREMGVNIPSVDAEVAQLSGGQRQAIAIARAVHSNASILLLDEPLAAMGVKEGRVVLELIARLKSRGDVSVVMIAHNYHHVLETCDRVAMVRDGTIALDKPTGETSVEELTKVAVGVPAEG